MPGLPRTVLFYSLAGLAANALIPFWWVAMLHDEPSEWMQAFHWCLPLVPACAVAAALLHLRSTTKSNRIDNTADSFPRAGDASAASMLALRRAVLRGTLMGGVVGLAAFALYCAGATVLSVSALRFPPAHLIYEFWYGELGIATGGMYAGGWIVIALCAVSGAAERVIAALGRSDRAPSL